MGPGAERCWRGGRGGRGGRNRGRCRQRAVGWADAFEAAPSDEVEVVTYNVLSSHLSVSWRYWHNDPEDVQPQARLERVFRKLAGPVERGAVVCLQECSSLWLGPTCKFFANAGYYFVPSLYAPPFGGSQHHGVGIAFPMSRYDLVDCLVQRVSEGKSWPRVQPWATQSQGQELAAWNFLDVYSYFGFPLPDLPMSMARRFSALGEEDEEELAEKLRDISQKDTWGYSMTRQHTMAAVKLKPKGGSDSQAFAVATYHMPCAYRNQKVMVIHAALAAQVALRFAQGCPLVLAGDWNFKPGSAPYQLLTSGKLQVAETDPAHVEYPEGEDWRVEDGLERLRSAYSEKHPGGEPEFTNYAWVKDTPDPFIGTLDYIFVSKTVEVLGVGRLPTIGQCPDPLPTKDEPSDHLMLNARLRPYPSQLPPAERRNGISRPAPSQRAPAGAASPASLSRPKAFGGGGGGLRGRGFGAAREAARS